MLGCVGKLVATCSALSSVNSIENRILTFSFGPEQSTVSIIETEGAESGLQGLSTYIKLYSQPRTEIRGGRSMAVATISSILNGRRANIVPAYPSRSAQVVPVIAKIKKLLRPMVDVLEIGPQEEKWEMRQHELGSWENRWRKAGKARQGPISNSLLYL